MSKSQIYLSPPHMGGFEKQYIDQAFEQNWIAPIGPNVDSFEFELGQYLGIKHVAAVSSGTAAIHLALINLGVERGDEVLVSSLTFSASVNPILYQSATPVFIDSEFGTWNMCPVLLRDAIVDRIKKTSKKPKAIIVVHLYGISANMNEIMKVSEEFQIPIIEDAAESLGSTYHNKHTSTMGLMGILSFNGNKIITTSGGGALVSNNENFIKHARFIATQARDNFPWYNHSHIGHNYRMSNVLAGIGRGQLKVLSGRIAQKQEVFQFYKKVFANIDGVSFIEEPHSTTSNRWLTCIQIDPKKTNGRKPSALIQELQKHHIEARHVWKPMHQQPVFEQFPAYVNGVSQFVFEQSVCLPSGTGMSAENFERIENVLKQYFF
jgi:dTDP-4-amino-4,6-dideoxygalactose transaminase